MALGGLDSDSQDQIVKMKGDECYFSHRVAKIPNNGH